MEVNLIGESLKFLVLGMSTVFMFLVLLVFVLTIQAKIMMKFFPPKEERVSVGHSISELSQKDNFTVVAAIAASIQAHKKKSNQ